MYFEPVTTVTGNCIEIIYDDEMIIFVVMFKYTTLIDYKDRIKKLEKVFI